MRKGLAFGMQTYMRLWCIPIRGAWFHARVDQIWAEQDAWQRGPLREHMLCCCSCAALSSSMGQAWGSHSQKKSDMACKWGPLTAVCADVPPFPGSIDVGSVSLSAQFCYRSRTARRGKGWVRTWRRKRWKQKVAAPA
eukprot:scaffold76163_cov23-Tisochrysis_lutea.AAC.2